MDVVGSTFTALARPAAHCEWSPDWIAPRGAVARISHYPEPHVLSRVIGRQREHTRRPEARLRFLIADTIRPQTKTLTRRSSVPRQDGIDAPNEGKEFRHVPAEKLGGRVIRHFAALVDKTRRELDVGFDRVHLR